MANVPWGPINRQGPRRHHRLPSAPQSPTGIALAPRYPRMEHQDTSLGLRRRLPRATSQGDNAGREELEREILSPRPLEPYSSALSDCIGVCLRFSPHSVRGSIVSRAATRTLFHLHPYPAGEHPRIPAPSSGQSRPVPVPGWRNLSNCRGRRSTRRQIRAAYA